MNFRATALGFTQQRKENDYPFEHPKIQHPAAVKYKKAPKKNMYQTQYQKFGYGQPQQQDYFEQN